MNAPEVRRILVALDASPHSHAALEEAAALAARLEAELTGIFVLDTDLLRFSGLPLAHETGLTSALQRTLDPERMERSLRLQAEQAHAALDAIARRNNLQSSFQLLRGNVLTELLAAAAKTDLLAMGSMGHMSVTGRRLGSTVRGVATRASCSVLLLRPRVRKGKSVVVAYGQSTNADRALSMATQLAARQDAALVVLLCGAADARPRLEAQARQIVEGAGLKAVFEVVEPGAFDALDGMLRRHDCGLLVIGRDCELIEGRDEQLGDLEVPVLLAR